MPRSPQASGTTSGLRASPTHTPRSWTRSRFPWGAGSEAVDAAIADRKRAEASVGQQRHDFEQEVLFQAARLNLLREQVAVAAKSDTIAQRRFDVAKDRYVIGKIDIPILFIAQSEKDNARQTNV